MQKRLTHIFSASLVALGISCAPALAQQPATNPGQPGVTSPAQNYSDAQLQKFMQASEKVAMISQAYTPKLQAAKDTAARQQIYQEADQKMVGVVKAEGLGVDEYNSLTQAVQKDPALAQRATKLRK